MSGRTIVSVVTLVLVGAVLYGARHSVAKAWGLIGQVDPWILSLVIPTVLLSYFGTGGMIFSYLRQKKIIDHLRVSTMMRISLELNFVNHVLPSGGASGVAYFNWRLGKQGVSNARSTMAQAVRYIAGFASITVLLLVGLVAVTIDGTVNRWLILMSAGLVIAMLVGTFVLYYVISDRGRMDKMSAWVTKTVNALVARVTLGKKTAILEPAVIDGFFADLHQDYLELASNKRLLIQPILWGILYTVMDVAMFWVTFWSFGVYVNPATILIAYNVAAAAGFLVATPGGVGAYEALMVLVIAMSGVDGGTALAGILLARTIILFVTIVGGYIFYQRAIMQYGTPKQLESDF